MTESVAVPKSTIMEIVYELSPVREHLADNGHHHTAARLISAMKKLCLLVPSEDQEKILARIKRGEVPGPDLSL